jgi:outer membrane protein assembly factor BamB
MGNSDDRETVFCFDAVSGKPLWKHSYPSKLGAVYHEGGPVSTPTVQGDHVYTISKWGDVFCFNSPNGTVIWEHDLRSDGVISNRWGFAGAPLVYGDSLILNAGAVGSALDLKTGRLMWLNGTQPTGYASPVIYRSGSGESVLIFAAKGLAAVDGRSGRELWRFPWETGWDTNNPDPLIYKNEIFISSFSRGCALLSVHDGQPKLVYDKKIISMHLSAGIVLGNYLYAFNGEAKQQTDFRCIDLSRGEIKWSVKDPAFGSVISCADSRLLILTEKGELLIGTAAPDEFRIISRAQIIGGLCWTPPALANGLLYARNSRGDIACVDLRSAPGP